MALHITAAGLIAHSFSWARVAACAAAIMPAVLAVGSARADEPAAITPAVVATTAADTGWIGKMPLASGIPAAAEGNAFALAQYIAFDDGEFTWNKVSEFRLQGATIHHLRVTSQRWRSDAEVNRPLWKHWVSVAVPDKVLRKTAILIIGGGRHRDEPQTSPPQELTLLVQRTGAVVVYIDNVPNQPLKLEGEGRGLVEDGLVARSWRLAMRDDDAAWLVRFPMVKSTVKAMDAAQEFVAELKRDTGREDLVADKFCVVGASKRGWTAWLTAAVDQRVAAIAPIVIDVLNIPAHTAHHWASYGFWAEALRDYNENEISKFFGSPLLRRITNHEDPLAYVSRVESIPKLIVTATGDEFFPADSFRHYGAQLKGEWRLRSVPNAAHNLRGSTAPLEILAFYLAVDGGVELPRVEWTQTPAAEGDMLVVRTSVKPQRVLLYEAENATARDFRLETTGPVWQMAEASADDEAGMTYTVKVTRPESGWKAYLVECAFPGPGGFPLVFTTQVYITPDTLPFADKKPE
jgi:PhoPQ-activated pathogenicity-related protein